MTTMSSPPDQEFSGFTPATLASLEVPGIAERWAAVQATLHPVLAALADALRTAGARRFPREWPLYEISYKSLRYVNRAPGERSPIDEYHFALDRPPRGAGVFVAVSAAERLIVVALQLGRARKPDLHWVWDAQRPIWQPIVEQVTEVRFTERRGRPENREQRTEPQNQEPRVGEAIDGEPGMLNAQFDSLNSDLWLDRYLANRAAHYLLAGFAYSWDDQRIAQPEFAEQVIADVLTLFPLNEAIMEHAEALDPVGAAILRERSNSYSQAVLPPIETIVAYIQGRGFALSDSLIRAYHVALQTKPLVILPGISGTGKTRLSRLYADAVYALAPGQPNEHYLLVAVQPDWHNARDLLGYFNAITGKYHPTPFLQFLQQAAGDPAALYFVCLDEMNLARPEYYLAPILAALETDDRLLDLGAPTTTVETVTGEIVPNPFRLPSNVRLTGTVNVDESTHALSDKLLDRANVIELTEVDLDAFHRSYRGPIDEAAWQAIVAIHAIVSRAGQPFGYRTIAEMLRYIEQARGVLPPKQALDQQIKQKILPKLRGEDTPRLRRALTALLEFLLGRPQAEWGKAASVTPAMLADAPLPASAEKVSRMLERLDSDGFTDFYG